MGRVFKLAEPYLTGASMQISESRFKELEAWREVVVGALELELLFSTFVESVYQFEKHLLIASLEELFDRGSRYRSQLEMHRATDELISSTNVRILTVLTAARSYHDQRHSILKNSGFNLVCLEEVKRLFSTAFDDSLNYRIFESLRNFAQHNALPVSGYNIKLQNRAPDGYGDGKRSVGRVSIQPYVRIEEMIMAKSKLRKKTITELEGLQEKKIDLRALIRSYFSTVSECHEETRILTGEKLDEAVAGLIEAKSSFIESSHTPDGCQAKHLTIQIHSGGEKIKEQYIDQVLWEKLETYRKSHTSLKSTRRWYVSSELVKGAGVFIGEFDDVWIDD